MAKEYKGIPAAFGAPVPDTFIDEVTGFDMINGTVRLDLAVYTRVEPIPQSDAVVSVIERLIMPIPTAQRLCVGLFDYLTKQGFDPKDVVGRGGAETAQ